MCAFCILVISAVIFIPKPVKQRSVETPEFVGITEPVETTVTILEQEYDIATTTSLDLSKKEIDDPQLNQIAKLTNLTELNLGSNTISDNNIKSLKEQLQNCNIQA